MKDVLKHSFEVLLKNGEYAEAEKLLVPYMKENPDDWDAKLLYGTCRMMQGDAETAKLVHQQAQGYFESDKDISVEQKSFWDKYKKLIFYGAIGTALVLAGGTYLGKQMQDVFVVLSSPPFLENAAHAKYAGPEYYQKKYAGPQQPPLVRVDQHKYAGPSYNEKEQDQVPTGSWQ